MIFSLSDLGPVSRVYSLDGADPGFSTSLPGIRHRISEVEPGFAALLLEDIGE
jgi:hypothetical protein